MAEPLSYLQAVANGFALVVAGWVYLAYVKNIQSSIALKDEQILTADRNARLWRDKANELEKKTPEYVEEVLAKRIKLREDEISRLDSDNEENKELLGSKNRELERLRSELEVMGNFERALTYYDYESDEEIAVPQSEIELEVLGEVFVDSGTLMITDPCYVNAYWNADEEFVDIRLFQHVSTDKIYRFGKDFGRYDEVISDLQKTANQLLEDNEFIKLKVQREFNYSYAGAAYASMSDEGYAGLKFPAGHFGAGVSFSTLHGDGKYTIFGERYKGDLVRVFVDIQ